MAPPHQTMGRRAGDSRLIIAWWCIALALLAVLPPPFAAAQQQQQQQCGSAAPPPASFFASAPRLKPASVRWTWNPWDTPPRAGVPESAQRSAAAADDGGPTKAPEVPRRTRECPDFKFVRPGVVASPEQVKALPLVLSRGPPQAKQSLASLIAWAAADLDKPPLAAEVVFVEYNPSKWDREAMTSAMLDAFAALKERAAAERAKGAVGHNEFVEGDARRAYNHTIAWLASGRPEYANKATALIDAWSTTTRSFGPVWANGPLEAAWGLTLLARAAELLRTGGADAWTPAAERRFFSFADALLVPNLRYYDALPYAYTAGNEAGTNWAGSILEARLQYAILHGDVGELEFVAARAQQWLGTYFLADGVTDETVRRDFMHGQFGIAGAVGVASLLLHQTRGRVDLFEFRAPTNSNSSSANSQPLLAAALELHSAALLGRADGPAAPLAGAELRYIASPPTRNDFKDANFEAALSVYARRGRALPATAELLRRSRPESLVLSWGLGTATVFGPDCVLKAPGVTGCAG